ncbi:MAG TPA: ribulose phosphate epimerase [Nannocystaceae bacterium]|nr:ribulose phosphate epimerase [Nannocystaceae bacterium]
MDSAIAFAIVLVACGVKDPGQPAASEEGAAAESSSGGAETTGSGMSGTGSVDPSTEGSSSESGSADGSAMSTTISFIIDPDGGVDTECDVWAQDCPEDEKCMPWSNDGTTWNATRCTALDPSPGEPGDACTADGSGASGIDDCALGSMCWDVDENNMGTCVAFCMGTAANPVCENPNESCTIANEGTVILCLPNCDPLLQECNDGSACYPVDDAFVCGPDYSGELGLYADPCEFINVCDPGLFCIGAAAVPGCTSAQCCTSFCDLDEPEATCPGAAGGQECVPWYDEGQAPPGLENLGACAIPA